MPIDWNSVHGQFFWAVGEMLVASIIMICMSARIFHRYIRSILPTITVIGAAPAFLIKTAVLVGNNVEYKQELSGIFLIDMITGLLFILLGFGLLYRETGLVSNGKPVDSMIDCFYFSTVTWTTVGYGDIVPAGRRSKLLVAYEAISGYFMMSLLFAQFVPMIHQMSLQGLLPWH